jgi:hypothetical protein
MRDVPQKTPSLITLGIIIALVALGGMHYYVEHENRVIVSAISGFIFLVGITLILFSNDNQSPQRGKPPKKP